jgi:hypothetical protein
VAAEAEEGVAVVGEEAAVVGAVAWGPGAARACAAVV